MLNYYTLAVFHTWSSKKKNSNWWSQILWMEVRS